MIPMIFLNQYKYLPQYSLRETTKDIYKKDSHLKMFERFATEIEAMR